MTDLPTSCPRKSPVAAYTCTHCGDGPCRVDIRAAKDATQPIRDALAAIEAADGYREDKEAVCDFHDSLTRTTVTAVLARLDAAELMVSTAKEIVRLELDSNGQAEAICLAIDAAMKGKP